MVVAVVVAASIGMVVPGIAELVLSKVVRGAHIFPSEQRQVLLLSQV